MSGSERRAKRASLEASEAYTVAMTMHANFVEDGMKVTVSQADTKGVLLKTHTHTHTQTCTRTHTHTHMYTHMYTILQSAVGLPGEIIWYTANTSRTQLFTQPCN